MKEAHTKCCGDMGNVAMWPKRIAEVCNLKEAMGREDHKQEQVMTDCESWDPVNQPYANIAPVSFGTADLKPFLPNRVHGVGNQGQDASAHPHQYDGGRGCATDGNDRERDRDDPWLTVRRGRGLAGDPRYRYRYRRGKHHKQVERERGDEMIKGG